MSWWCGVIHPTGNPILSPMLPVWLMPPDMLESLLAHAITSVWGRLVIPEGHIEAESKEKRPEFLKLKVDKGAGYILTNYFYDNRYYFDFVDNCRRLGLKVPIVPGIMPIFSLKMMANLAKLCGSSISADLRQRRQPCRRGHIPALLRYIDFAFDQCKELIGAGVPGLHFYIMDRATHNWGRGVYLGRVLTEPAAYPFTGLCLITVLRPLPLLITRLPSPR